MTRMSIRQRAKFQSAFFECLNPRNDDSLLLNLVPTGYTFKVSVISRLAPELFQSPAFSFRYINQERSQRESPAKLTERKSSLSKETANSIDRDIFIFLGKEELN